MSLSRYVFLIWVTITGLFQPGEGLSGKADVTAGVSPGPGMATDAAKPFPQHVGYRHGSILPNHISRKRMDDSVRSFYKAWKQRYIREGCNEGEYYVWFEGPETHNKLCVSEGQGYGMMITALMAGFDTSARTVYNGLYRYYRNHPSKNDPHLMAWAQKKDCRSVDGSSATDGDMDIAYSLLLADAQWGSNGNIAYKEEGKRMVAAILKQEINQKTYSVLLSNSSDHYSKDYFDMRSSDFMPAHFRAFRDVSGDEGWDKVIDNNYKLFQHLQETYSPDAGLLPDFINKIEAQPKPAKPNYLESRYDGAYNYNACRMPWRIATDFIVNGDQRAADIVGKINRWIRSTTKGNPDNISAGYSLAGVDLKNRYYEALCFIAPFSVSAMVGNDNQTWLNKLWDYTVNFKLRGFDYYDNSIKMINMIILSGNYWTPEV